MTTNVLQDGISVSRNINATNPEVEISGSRDALVRLASAFDGTRNVVSIPLAERQSKFYPKALELLVVVCDESRSSDLVNVQMIESRIEFSGAKSALLMICDSLVNVFEASCEAGEHFHLDYYPGNQVLEETPISLIFMCSE